MSKGIKQLTNVFKNLCNMKWFYVKQYMQMSQAFPVGCRSHESIFLEEYNIFIIALKLYQQFDSMIFPSAGAAWIGETASLK